MQKTPQRGVMCNAINSTNKKKDGSESFRVQVNVDGVRDSASFDNRAEAKQWGKQREAELRVGIISAKEISTPAPSPKTKSDKSRSDTSSRTLKDVLERYRKEVTPSKLSRRWEEIKLLKIARYKLASMRLSELGPEHFAEWRDGRLKEVSPSSVRRELAMISCTLEIARKESRW